MLRIAQRRRLRVGFTLPRPRVGGVQNAQALGIRGHDAVFDAVVNHFDEMARAVRTAMQVALFGGTAKLLATGRAGNIADAGRQGCENGIQTFNDVLFAADHHAITAFQSPDAAACAHVHVMNSFRSQFLRAPDVIHVVGIASVNEDVASLQER